MQSYFPSVMTEPGVFLLSETENNRLKQN